MTSLPFSLAPDVPPPGFTFDNYRRNEYLKQKGFHWPEPIKTGTTIAGLVYKDGVVLGADTRSTESERIVADKNCEKIYCLSPNTYCCGAGTAADTTMATRLVAAQLQLLALHTSRPARVVSAAMLLKRLLYRYQAGVYAALILGGVDAHGPHIYSIYPHGSTDKLPYATLGSGAYAAMALLEARWKVGMSEDAATRLLRDAVLSGIFNDLGSGSNVDICVIRKNGVAECIRGYCTPNERGAKLGSYRFPRGTTVVQRARVVPLDVEYERIRHIRRLLPAAAARPARSRSRSPTRSPVTSRPRRRRARSKTR